jgi:hypothetical protein
LSRFLVEIVAGLSEKTSSYPVIVLDVVRLGKFVAGLARMKSRSLRVIIGNNVHLESAFLSHKSNQLRCAVEFHSGKIVDHR